MISKREKMWLSITSSFDKFSLAFAVCCALFVNAQASIIEVNNNGDDGVDCTLREAISNAENNNDGGGNGCGTGSALPDIITFDMPSLASPTVTLNSSLVFSVNNSVITIDGPMDNALVLDGNSVSSIMEITATGPITLNHLNFQNGSANVGGALNINTTLVNINNSVISGNRAIQEGAGIYIDSGALFIKDSTISNNLLKVGDILVGKGGGISSTKSPMDISQSIISGNQAREGGGIYSSEGNSSIPGLNIVDSTIENNMSDLTGGGIDQRFADFYILNSTIRNNTSAFDGGGLYTMNSDVFIIDSTIDGNHATSGAGDGGGASMLNSISEISGSTFSNNSAGVGGGGINIQGSSSTIKNSTISSNQAAFAGGISVNSGATLNLINSTVVLNVGESTGGGLSLGSIGSNLIINNSVIAGNIARIGSEVNFLGSGTISTSGVNLLGDNSKDSNNAFGVVFTPGISDITATSDGTLPTALGSTIDSILRNNGGKTFTHKLSPKSPAINSADITDCGPGKLLEFDQRGRNRDETCDIGSVEFIDDETCFVISTENAKLVVFCL